MGSSTTVKLKRRLRRVKATLRRSRARQRLSRDLAGLTNKDLTDLLARAGLQLESAMELLSGKRPGRDRSRRARGSSGEFRRNSQTWRRSTESVAAIHLPGTISLTIR